MEKMVFGQLPIDPKALATEVISAVRSQKSDSSPDWTRAVKEVLRRCGEERDFAVHTALRGREKQHYEWLLDLLWCNRTTGSVSLAVESEWGGEEDVLYDFSKLLVMKAPLKLMVYFAYKGSFVARFEKEYLSAFDHHVKGEQYLLVEFQGLKDRSYLYEVPNDGTVSSVRFSELNLERGTTA
jgi:hypothetical protein